MIRIISFYEFKDLGDRDALERIKMELKEAFMRFDIRGTVIIAHEGYNGMVCGEPANIESFVSEIESVLQTQLVLKSSIYDEPPFRKIDVKIKPEIVTLKQQVDMSLGAGTHVSPDKWNEVISASDTVVLDARNDYEYRTGTFKNAVNPATEKFSDLPAFVVENLDPARDKRIAMFCTGGIRCEKFAPYLKQQGFEEVYQLRGGILKYIEEVPPEESLWQGECFVFDERISVDATLKKGVVEDHSHRSAKRKKAKYKIAE